MKASTECIHCILKKSDSLYEMHKPQDPEKVYFIKDVCKIISESPEGASAPQLAKYMMDRMKTSINIDEYYASIKESSNSFMLSREEKIRARIANSKEPIRSALQYSMTGNLIDFGALDDVDMELLDSILDQGEKQDIDMTEYASFLAELKKAKKMVYLLDNAGEIVLDKLFIEIIQKHFPDLEITAIVRGKPIYNDVTMEDAKTVGLDQVVTTIGNGTDFPGTQLDFLPKDVLKIVDEADLILAKGQGNFESLYGCGKNIYYAFLCKCDMFVDRFNMKKYQGIFEHEERCSYDSAP